MPLAHLQNQCLTQKSVCYRAKFPDTSRTPFPSSALQHRADEKRTGGSKAMKRVKRMKVGRERTASAP